MSLMDKIEEIRQKPEHEKIRYVWGMVAICMIFIFFVWIFSFKDLMRGNGNINSGSDTLDGLDIKEDDIQDGAIENIQQNQPN